MSVKYDHPRTEMLQFLPDGASRILDVGCSSGAFGRVLRAAAGSITLTGVEPVAAAAAQARDHYDNVYEGFFPDALPADGTVGRYDVIFFNDVLEHMPEPETALAAAKDLLVPGGMLIASIPNVRHISVLGQLAVRGQWRYRDSGILDRTHLRFFTRRSMLEMFRTEGWAVSSVQGINKVLRVGQERTPGWIRVMSAISKHRTDDFLYVQYVVVAAAD